MQPRLLQSDVVIFLDVPEDTCTGRAEIRIEAEQYSPNQDIAAGCIYGEVRERQMEVIKYFHESLRPKLINLLSELGGERVVTICSYDDVTLGCET